MKSFVGVLLFVGIVAVAAWVGAERRRASDDERVADIVRVVRGTVKEECLR